ncbi:uncharacterized protein [Miscanthus floridulus]|uniref:uncharacterized protein n=1 Tax=Miscanthus floridulus TaxID=154761 RepID=UPI0034598350
MVHPSDGEAWVRFNDIHRDKADEARLEKEVTRAAEASVAVQAVLEAEIREHNALQSAGRTACEAPEVRGVKLGSSLESRLIALSGRVHERLRGALHTGVKRALAVVSSHYAGINLEAVSDGYVVAKDDEKAKEEVMKLVEAGEAPGMALARLFEEEEEAEGVAEGSDRRRRRRTARHRRGPSPPTPHEEEPEEEVAPVDESNDELVWQTDKEEELHEDNELEAAGTGSASSDSSSSVYLRGPTSLPHVPLPHQCPVIHPEGQKNWVVVSGGSARLVNGILGLLCRQHFPGIVTYASKTEHAYSIDHYAIATDAEYPNKAARVKAELWTYYRCEEGFEARWSRRLPKPVKNSTPTCITRCALCIQAIVTYYGSKLGERKTKKDAREMQLTREQYH